MINLRTLFLPVLIVCAAESGLAAPVRFQCWVIVDFDSLLCPGCLEPLLGFCRALPASVQEDRLLGVVVFRPAKNPGEGLRRRRIVEAQWNGFRKAHDIRFPAVLDDGPVFRRWLTAGAAKVLCFDERARTFRELELPLRPGRFDELLSLLLN
jgi:hypothetical protein